MPDFLPVPPTSAITDKQIRAVLDVLSQNIQVSIDKFNALGTATNTSTAAPKGGFNSFGTGASSITNNANLSASYTKANALADLAVPLAAKLNKSASDILSGPIDFTTYGGFKTSGMTIASDGTATGQGVAFTSKGIVGRNSTTTTFTIDSTTGNATFGGALNAATGTFYGDITGGANINIAGQAIFYGMNTAGFPITIAGIPSLTVDYSSLSAATTSPASTTHARAGVVGFTQCFNSRFNVGVMGIGATTTGTINGIGVVGNGDSIGGYFDITSSSGVPLVANNSQSSSGIAFQISQGKFQYGSTIISAPPGTNTTYLAGDGVWYPISGITAGVSSFNGRPGAVTLLSSDVTGALGYTPYDSSNPSGYVTSSTSSLSNYSTTSTTVSYIQSYSAHQFNADSGTAYVSSGNINIYVSITGFQSSGSGNTITIQNVSDRRLKENIVPENLGLNFIKQLIPVSYNMIKGAGRKMHGFIAQDVEPLIADDNDALKITNEDGSKGVDYLSLIGPMTKAIQELSAKVDDLEAKLAETRT